MKHGCCHVVASSCVDFLSLQSAHSYNIVRAMLSVTVDSDSYRLWQANLKGRISLKTDEMKSYNLSMPTSRLRFNNFIGKFPNRRKLGATSKSPLIYKARQLQSTR